MAVSDNLGLYLPDREDYISVQRDLKSNYEIIDEHAGMVEDGIAIVINGDTAPRAISSGQYLMIKNHSTLATGGYHATANIANGASVTSSNVAADSDGIANALNSKITRQTISNNAKNDNVELGIIRIEEIDEIISITFIDVKTKQDVAPHATLIVGSVPSGYRPLTSCFTRGGGAAGGVGHDVGLVVYASGEIQIQNRGSNNSRMYANGNIIYFKNTL